MWLCVCVCACLWNILNEHGAKTFDQNSENLDSRCMYSKVLGECVSVSVARIIYASMVIIVTQIIERNMKNHMNK